MSSKGDLRRLLLFKRYAANLKVHCPEAQEWFVCPICARPFVADDVRHDRLKVDIGHVYPRHAGGRLVTLECCECNHRLNRCADNELIRLHQHWDAMKPGGKPVKASLQFPAGRVGIDVSADGIQSDWTRANPQAFNEAIHALIHREPISYCAPVTRPGKVNLAVLHSAHLLLFRAFGYGYLFTPTGQYTRHTLATSSVLDDATFLSMDMTADTGVEADMLHRVGVCTFKSGEKCLFASLPAPDPKVVLQFILLPGLWKKDVELFSRIMSHADSWINATFQTIDGAPMMQLRVPEYANALHLLWRGWQRHNIDMTKIMHAIRAEVDDDLLRKVDVVKTGERFGLEPDYLKELVNSLVKRGFLVRAPKKDRPLLIRLTDKSVNVPMTATRIRAS